MPKNSKMLTGTSLLRGDNTIPGVKVHKEVLEQLPLIYDTCRKFGLDFYPTIIEFLTYDEISEIASYGGFPVRYPHWKHGMEYEELSRGYEYGQHRISEMVINTSPCYIYCLDSNTLVDNVDVIAHALGHNDFFKNNVFFANTDTGMMNKMGNHAYRIRKYMARWGKEKVTEFIDHCLRLDTLIDTSKNWRYKKKFKSQVIQDERHYRYPDRRYAQNEYMDEWVNNEQFLDKERKRVEKEDAAEQLELFKGGEKDIFGHLRDNAPLSPWQQDIIAMLYEEAMYFAPQRLTKMINEGWASYVDFCIMCREGLVAAGQPTSDSGIVEYAKHKMLVLGGKYSQNPYKTGFELLMHIEERWNKGRFGQEYDNCDNLHDKEHWDKKLGLGKDKVFEVRQHYNDFMLIQEFFTKEFFDKMEYYEWAKMPNGNYEIVDRDHKSVKKKLMQRFCNGGLPDIRLEDPNHLGKGWYFLQHHSDGRQLYDSYTRETLVSIFKLWKNTVVLATKNEEGEEFVYVCDGPELASVRPMKRTVYEKEMGLNK